MLDPTLRGMFWQLFAAVLLCGLPYVHPASKGQRVKSSPDIPATQFTCVGRPPGYYADVETGCQVYHMCTEGSNQFSYRCPNTTLFQQRMLICAHWYQVNCSRSEQHYDNNLLIGQRDKPFVNDDSVLTKDKRLKTLQNPDALQNLSPASAGREGSARQAKSQANSDNNQVNRVVQNNFKRDQELSVGFPGKSTPVTSSPSLSSFPATIRRMPEDFTSLPLAGSVLPGGLKSVQFSRGPVQASPFRPSFQSPAPLQQSSTSRVQFVSNAPQASQKVTQTASFVSPSSTPNSVDSANIFATTHSPSRFTSKFFTDNQNKFEPSGFKKQPLIGNTLKPGSSTSRPGFEFLPPSAQNPSADLAVASQENALSGRTSTTPEPEAEIGGGLPEIESTIKAIIEEPKNGSLPDDKHNTFIKRFNPYEEPPQPTTETKTEETEKEYHTFINRFVPNESASGSQTNIRQPVEKHVFINRFVLTPEELQREKDRVQVEKLHNLQPPDDQLTVNFPNFDLIPPLDDSADSESNKIELHLQDPRRTLFIPRDEDSDFSKADAAPIVVSIPLHSHEKSAPMWFRTDDSSDPCARCHPSFLVNKETCMPCVIIR